MLKMKLTDTCIIVTTKGEILQLGALPIYELPVSTHRMCLMSCHVNNQEEVS